MGEADLLGGVTVGYLVLPKGIQVLVSFAPESIQVLLNLGDYLSFMLRTVLVFGIAAQIPLVVVLLNRIGAVSARQLAAARPWTILGIFVFAAIATPSTDPFSMIMLAIPMSLLFLVSEGIARVVDRRRAGRDGFYDDLSDDEVSPLDERLDAVQPSRLDEDDD